MSDSNNKIDIDLSNETAQGTYANLAIVTHSSSEFVLDFVRMMPGLPKPEVKSRVIVTPEHAKRLLATLSDNLAKYEKAYGKITDHDPRSVKIPLNFENIGEA